MAVVPKLRQDEIDDIGDITYNLESLLFESALSNEEQELLYLRKRSHALSVTACAQASYFIAIVNQAREIQVQLHNPTKKNSLKLMQDGTPRDPLLIGILGCGRLGSHLAHCLLTIAEVQASELKISTRRPETLTELQQKGVACMNDNVSIASSVHVLFLCVLPSQLQQVAEQIRGYIPPKCLVYSLVASTSLVRLRQLLHHTNIMKPQYHFSERSSDNPWNHQLEITSSFAHPSMLTKTCPLCSDVNGAVVWTDERCWEQFMYAFVNMCSTMGLGKTETSDVINAVMFGHSTAQPLDDVLDTWDISSKSGKIDSMFPLFDLCTVTEKETPLRKKLQYNDYLRDAFLEKYCSVFQQYLDWKNQALQLAKNQVQLSYD